MVPAAAALLPPLGARRRLQNTVQVRKGKSGPPGVHVMLLKNEGKIETLLRGRGAKRVNSQPAELRRELFTQEGSGARREGGTAGFGESKRREM